MSWQRNKTFSYLIYTFSVDSRDRDFSLAERWSDENVFANRAYFMPEKQPAELGVDHIRESDQGIYRCRVDFKIAQTRNSKINLTVIGESFLKQFFYFYKYLKQALSRYFLLAFCYTGCMIEKSTNYNKI